MSLSKTALSLLTCTALVAALAWPAAAGAAPRKAEPRKTSGTAAKSKSGARAAAAPTRSVSSRTRARGAKVAYVQRRAAPVVPARPSFGQMAGLHATEDPLDLKSSVALVLDQDTNEVLLAKNPQAVLPIASITKLMTALVVIQAGQSLDDVLTITDEDVDTEKGSRSRLGVGTQLTRGEMLHLALMSSENRAAHALGRHYPGGMPVFVAAMNARAKSLGMNDTRYVEPTGLSSENQSSARDLALLVKTASTVPLIRELSTSPEHQVAIGNRLLQYHTTNRLVLNPGWEIGVQKTGYISEAGQCLVMQARLAGRQLIMVLLDSAGRYSRIGDAERIRKWIAEQLPASAAPATTTAAAKAPAI